MMNNIIEQTVEYVKNTLYHDPSGHDWWHIYRVWNTAKKIAALEKADLLIVELAALLHDIADWKEHHGDCFIGTKTARKWLEKFPELKRADIDEICFIVENVSFKGADVKNMPLSLEGKIVQDADRLDAIGAIGIARTFAYGGSKRRLIYDPAGQPSKHQNPDSYIHSHSSTIHHFYEKLLLLKDLMNTDAGRKIAEHRHQVMENFLSEFYAEWKGDL